MATLLEIQQLAEISQLEHQIVIDKQATVGVKVTAEMMDKLTAKSERLKALKTEVEYVKRLVEADRRLCPELTPERYRQMLDAGRTQRLIEADIDARKAKQPVAVVNPVGWLDE